jgi:hypothetical protein
MVVDGKPKQTKNKQTTLMLSKEQNDERSVATKV